MCHHDLQCNDKKPPNKILKDKNVSIGAKGLYFYILNTENIQFQSRNKIAYELNISNATLGKYLKELTQSGYLKCTQSKENGRFGNNCYFIQNGD